MAGQGGLGGTSYSMLQGAQQNQGSASDQVPKGAQLVRSELQGVVTDQGAG